MGVIGTVKRQTFLHMLEVVADGDRQYGRICSPPGWIPVGQISHHSTVVKFDFFNRLGSVQWGFLLAIIVMPLGWKCASRQVVSRAVISTEIDEQMVHLFQCMIMPQALNTACVGTIGCCLTWAMSTVTARIAPNAEALTFTIGGAITGAATCYNWQFGFALHVLMSRMPGILMQISSSILPLLWAAYVWREVRKAVGPNAIVVPAVSVCGLAVFCFAAGLQRVVRTMALHTSMLTIVLFACSLPGVAVGVLWLQIKVSRFMYARVTALIRTRALPTSRREHLQALLRP